MSGRTYLRKLRRKQRQARGRNKAQAKQFVETMAFLAKSPKSLAEAFIAGTLVAREGTNADIHANPAR